jgi:ABC-type polysaccharide/polyol phosphate transport system ATPase subunit
VSVAIKVENISKQYRLGEVGTGTLSHDLHRAWAKLRGKPDPFAKVGEVNDREQVGGEYAWALRDISFDVEQGEILGIIGRNGAGKSTLLKILSRVTAPTSGKIKTRGRIASLLEVGTGFHPELTGRENVYLNGAIMGMTRSEIARRLEEIVEFSGCAKYIDTPVKRYSSGMTVRLGFAVAAHLDCETLIVDEVLAVGDVEFQKKCIGKMQDVAENGRTVLFVSHNMSSVSRLTSKCIVIDAGKVSAICKTSEAIEYYLSGGEMQIDQGDDLSNRPRLPFCCGTAIVRKLKTEKSKFSFGESLKASITIRANRSLPSIYVQFTFFTLDGTPVTSSCSKSSLTMADGEEKSIGVTLENPVFAPGQYYLDIGLLSNYFLNPCNALDVVTKAISFEVLPQDKNTGLAVNWNHSWGSIKSPDLIFED